MSAAATPETPACLWAARCDVVFVAFFSAARKGVRAAFLRQPDGGGGAEGVAELGTILTSLVFRTIVTAHTHTYTHTRVRTLTHTVGLPDAWFPLWEYKVVYPTEYFWGVYIPLARYVRFFPSSRRTLVSPTCEYVSPWIMGHVKVSISSLASTVALVT